jgi:protein tyrosine/serine phosphatase
MGMINTHNTVAGRELDIEGVQNARDLGGLSTAHGRTTRRGVLVRTANLSALTQRGHDALVAHGVRTIIDLRTPEEVQARPNALAGGPGSPIQTLHQPLISDDPAVRAQVWNLPNFTVWNERMLRISGREIATSLRTIVDAPPGGILFHCFAGKDRTGLLAMLALSLVGAPAEPIVHDYAVSASRLGPLVEEVLSTIEKPEERQLVATYYLSEPETAHNTLAHLNERYGGAEAYLRHIGLNGGEIDGLRARLLGD